MKWKVSFFVVALEVASLSTASASDATGPGPGFQEDNESSKISPDGTIEVRQYFKPGDDYVFQFWTFDRNHHHAHLLNPGESGTITEYGAGFRFSPNSQWLVRMQKVAAGESTLFLYKRNGAQYFPATPKPLGDLAWDYFFTQPESKGVDSRNLSPETDLQKGMEDNYAWLGVHWPDSRYVVISLESGESHTTVVGPWQCRYDMKTGQFDVTPEMARFNRDAAKSNK